VMGTIGIDRFSAISSDDTGNTHLARQILESAHPNIINLPDPLHHLNNTFKEISALPFFQPLIKILRVVLKFFKQSKPARVKLKDLRIRNGLGPGLESIGKTRFLTHVWSAESLRRLLPAIRTLATGSDIDVPKYQNLFQSNTLTTLQLEILLNQYLAVGLGPARAVECLEAASTNVADVYLYCLAVLRKITDALDTHSLPDHIRAILVRRWRQFFINGPTNIHLCGFYLHPRYVQSSVFKNPNPLTFNITLPSKQPSPVPAGVRNPKTFLEVAKYLHHIAVNEIMHGNDPILLSYKNRPKTFTKAFQAQFTAYAQRTYPFAMPIGAEQDPLDWWIGIKGQPNTDVLSAIAIKIFSATPHSMADERTMSAISIYNSALRNKLSVDIMVAMTQIKNFYRKQQGIKLRKSARPHPVVKFYNIERILRPIDDDEDGNRDFESDDETDDGEELEGSSTNIFNAWTPHEASLETSDVLPIIDDNEEINIESFELQDLISDAPVPEPSQSVSSSSIVVEPFNEEDEEGLVFALGDWVTE
ncbi:hypothetical protein H0H92_009504, partial [Tricholoma furcatifolium]